MDEKLKTIIDESKKIVFFGGAGVSTESNIPDFRSGDGLYNAQKEYGLPPESLISYSFFITKPGIFYDYYKKNLIYKDAEPNKAHKALARLEGEGKLSGVITQNIDGLHQVAGSKNVVELHGSVRRNYCMECGTNYDLDYILADKNCIDKDGNPGPIPWCKKCGSMVRPDVVLYEEALAAEDLQKAVGLITESDTMIVGGTSLVVYPAAGLLQYFKGKNLVLINKTETPFDGKASLVYHKSIGKVLF